MKDASHRARRWLVATLVAAAAGALAHPLLQMLERHDADVHRLSPAVVDLGEGVLQRLRVPPGFEVSLYARGLGKPRMMTFGPDGTLYVTRRDVGDVLAVRDEDGDGRAESVHVLIDQLPNVHGIAWHDGQLYLASSTTVWTTSATAPSARVLIDGLPDGGQHGNRMLRFGPDGWMYISIGSSCNDCAEQNQLERATIVRYTPDGRQREFVANGLRNTIGYDWHPRAGALWGMDHGSDYRGDRIPPEELNEIKPGLNYGWPICYGERTVDPMTNAQPMQVSLIPGEAMPSMVGLTREQHCARTEPSTLTYAAHAAPMAMLFHDGRGVPPNYDGDAFVAMRGSWNRSEPVGYKVVRIAFANGRPVGWRDFLVGFRSDDGTQVYGRPVGLAIGSDGSLFVSDDAVGAIYRVRWTGRS